MKYLLVIILLFYNISCSKTSSTPIINELHFYTASHPNEAISEFYTGVDNVGIYADITDDDGDLQSITIRKMVGTTYPTAVETALWTFPLSGGNEIYINNNIEASVISLPNIVVYEITAIDGKGHSSGTNLRQLAFTNEPTISTSAASHAFGSVTVSTTSAATSFTISNTGSGSMEIFSSSITGANHADFLISTDNISDKTIASGGNGTISVSFKPSALGARSANLVIPWKHHASTNLIITLTGTGI
jgi:hypothetical protein